ncbi:hypothetical protein Ate01nite_43110 [Actinoplanes teichomyceticus]|nr:hypothetical protein Ate01nite_43110 [Actinoplanes teichomyceticus]
MLGTGRMGGALAGRLCANGHRVTVWNRHRQRTAEAARAGAGVAASAAEAVAAADLVITMLTDGGAVEAVLFGQGAATALRPGAVLVQMSTIGPAETAAFLGRLPAGVHFVDAPVGGSVDAVAAGSLTVLAGGTTEALQRAEPVLRELGTVRRCGDVGEATRVKLVLNTAWLTALGALHDTLGTAAALGLDRQVTLELLAAGPLAGALRRANSATADFAVALAVKDLDLTYGETPDRPVVAATRRLLHDLPDQDADLATIVDLGNR